MIDRDDDALMLLAKDGYRQAFDQLVSRHQLLALRVAKKYTHDNALAADIDCN